MEPSEQGAPSQPAPQTVYVERQSNGYATASLVLGVIGVVFGLIPLFFWVALVLGLVGLALGVVGILKGRVAGRLAMAWIGTILAVAALALGVWGAVIVDDAFGGDSTGHGIETT